MANLLKSFLLAIVLHQSFAFGSKEVFHLAFTRIEESLKFAEEKREFHPTTIRIVTFSDEDIQFIYPLELNWKNPVIRANINNHTFLKPQIRKQSKHVQLFTFITLFVVLDPADVEKIPSVIRESVDPRRDFVIFVCTGQLVKPLRNLGGLREKIVIDVDSSTGIWVDPVFHNGDMINVDIIENIIIGNPMGANLPGRHLRAAAPETPPYNFKAGEDSNGNSIIDGSLCRIFQEAGAKFNFSYFINYEGFDYGTLHPNGTWTGAYSKVHYPDSGYDMDLIVSPELLWNQLDTAAVATYVDMIFGVAHPKANQHWYAFLLPFEMEVWICVFIMFVFLGAVQGVAMYFVQGRKMKPIVYESTSLLPFAITMEQGLQDIPAGIRYFSLILLFGCTVLGTGYKSTLRTHLMFPKPDHVPTTFQELADRVDYTPTLTVLGALEKHFWATSEVQAVKKIRERLTFDTNWENCYKNALLDKKKACISWNNGRYVVAKKLTLNTTLETFVYSNDAAIRKFLSLGFQENSIYVDSFSPITGTMGAMGIVTKWETDIRNSFKTMGRLYMLNQTGTNVFNELLLLSTPQRDQVPLQLQSLFVVIGFIPVGGILGVISFACELWLTRNKRNLHKRQDKSSNTVGSLAVEISDGNSLHEIESI